MVNPGTVSEADFTFSRAERLSTRSTSAMILLNPLLSVLKLELDNQCWVPRNNIKGERFRTLFAGNKNKVHNCHLELRSQ